MTVTNELSVRPDRGSEALRFVRWRGRRQDYTAPRLVILIHGFNTSEKKARNSYREFLENLALQSAGHLGTRSYSMITATFWTFYWPGDHSSYPVSMTIGTSA